MHMWDAVCLELHPKTKRLCNLKYVPYKVIISMSVWVHVCGLSVWQLAYLMTLIKLIWGDNGVHVEYLIIPYALYLVILT